MSCDCWRLNRLLPRWQTGDLPLVVLGPDQPEAPGWLSPDGAAHRSSIEYSHQARAVGLTVGTTILPDRSVKYCPAECDYETGWKAANELYAAGWVTFTDRSRRYNHGIRLYPCSGRLTAAQVATIRLLWGDAVLERRKADRKAQANHIRSCRTRGGRRVKTASGYWIKWPDAEIPF